MVLLTVQELVGGCNGLDVVIVQQVFVPSTPLTPGLGRDHIDSIVHRVLVRSHHLQNLIGFSAHCPEPFVQACLQTIPLVLGCVSRLVLLASEGETDIEFVII